MKKLVIGGIIGLLAIVGLASSTSNTTNKAPEALQNQVQNHSPGEQIHASVSTINLQVASPSAQVSPSPSPSPTPIPSPKPTLKPSPATSPITQNTNSGNSNGSYINVDGNKIQSPTFSDTVPNGATAKCKDGSYSFSQHRSGTCSGHKGVASWL